MFINEVLNGGKSKFFNWRSVSSHLNVKTMHFWLIIVEKWDTAPD